MQTISEYLNTIEGDKKQATTAIYHTILNNIPAGFQAEISCKMIGFVVPHSIYPAGYHCSPKLPLPFINIAAQKNAIVLHHLGIYADENLRICLESEYPKHSKTKLDMGKVCIRFKKMNKITLEIIAALSQKMTVQNWIDCYEKFLKK